MPATANLPARREDDGHSEIQRKLLDLARERIASPAEQLRRFLAAPAGSTERALDEDRLELRNRVVEQCAVAQHESMLGPTS